MRIIVAILSFLLAGASAGAQERVLPPDSPDAKLRGATLKALRDDVNQRDVEAWRKIATKADWEKFRDERIAALRASLGQFPEAPKEVKVITTKKIYGAGFTIENIIYESRPGFYVTANLYVPEKTSKPMPGFLIIHSHHNPRTQSELQDMGMNWARQGCLVLIPDQIDHGERRQHPFVDAKSYPGAFKLSRQDYYFRYNAGLQLHLIGDSLIGWMVWDMMRGLDVLLQRPGIDKNAIVVLGSVAGGGDPCAVLTALDTRVTASVPFNFGRTSGATKSPASEFDFNFMGGGSWESTRNLRLSGRDGFLPWVIVGAAAPRGLIYAHEFAWDAQRDPVWARFQKIWGFYGAADKLASLKGRGAVTGKPPEATHCNNIGPVHRQQIYPTFNKWFGLPVPEKEYQMRLESKDLQCWTEEARQQLQPKMVHQLAQQVAAQRLRGKLSGDELRHGWLKLLGVSQESLNLPGKVEKVQSKPISGMVVGKQIYRREGKHALAVPVLMLRPLGTLFRNNAPNAHRVVIALAQDGKAGFLKHRAETIAALLKSGVAVCIPDLRGTGETSADGRGRQSGSTGFSATELMHGRTVAGTQLQELVMLMRELQRQGFGAIALWGDSFAEPNDPKMNLAVPLDADKLPRQAEPMGGLLAQLGGLFGGDAVKAIYVRGGLVSFRSILDSPFCYVPHDAVIPGVLTVADLDALAAAQPTRNVRLEGLVDGRNRRVDQKELSNVAEVAAWLGKNR